MPLAFPNLIQRFNDAADRYDQTASMQAQVAEQLVTWANPTQNPQNILDLGSGTGFAAAAAQRKWPSATLTALDHAPAMLRQAQNKIPNLNIISADAARFDFKPQFDVIFSSMMLHWVGGPLATLRQWQKGLKPGGQIYVALLTERSFVEWRDLCRVTGIKDGLWPMPPANFADGFATQTKTQTIKTTYASAHDFLQRLKNIGAATAHPDHKPINASAMRNLLKQAAQPFSVTHEILYLQIPSPASI